MKRRRLLHPVLAIGGLDPSGHAGLLADARVFDALGIPFKAAVTALTAQSEKKFYAWKSVDLALFRQELEAAGTRLSGVKIGMLGTAAHLRETLRWLKKNRPAWVVWDPVWRSSTGAKLFRGTAAALLALLPDTDLWTPNLPEAEIFLDRSIRTRGEAREAARELWNLGRKKSRLLILKGGHLAGEKSEAVDWFVESGKLRELKGPRFPLAPRGTGCTFASACLGALVSGKSPWAAARSAKDYVWRTLFGK